MATATRGPSWALPTEASSGFLTAWRLVPGASVPREEGICMVSPQILHSVTSVMLCWLRQSQRWPRFKRRGYTDALFPLCRGSQGLGRRICRMGDSCATICGQQSAMLTEKTSPNEVNTNIWVPGLFDHGRFRANTLIGKRSSLRAGGAGL